MGLIHALSEKAISCRETHTSEAIRPIPALIFAAIFLIASSVGARAETSALWGESGEKWGATNRLPDFSFAGYRRGEEPFRIPREHISVAAFGAKGDGVTDDTGAFAKAIAAGAGRLIEIPAGRFVLNDVLELRRSGTVLRGAGSDKTILLFRKPLEDLRPKAAQTDGKQPTTGWSWGGGLITIGGDEAKPEKIVRVSAPARRGETSLETERAVFKTGDEVVLTVRDDKAKSLPAYLYRGQTGDLSGLNNWRCRQVFRVVAVADRVMKLDRPLRFDVRPEWQPELQAFRPSVTDAGVEGIAFEFPATRYAGHFREVGFNPVEIGRTAAHCWLRDLRIWNADSGPYVRGTFCTLYGIRVGADPQRKSAQGHTGHHGITFYGLDCLCANFTIETQFIHDLTVQSAMGCVFCSGRAENLCMDHHRWAPYENLFTDIDAGEGTRLFMSGGGGERGNHTAAGETFWNIRTHQPAANPKSLGNDAINIVGMNLRDPPAKLLAGMWYEPIPPGKVQPANLHAAMLAARIAAKRPRLAVLTDIGGDPDDQQALVRLMAYANEFEFEALVASASGTPGELKREITRPDLIREIISGYAKVLSNLRRHAGGWPEPEQLLARVKSGNPKRGRANIGEGYDSEASRFLVERIDAGTPERPLNISIWGGQTDFAQAIWRVKKDRGAAAFGEFVKKFHVYDIGDQDGITGWIRGEFPGMFYILAQAPAGRDRRDAVYRGMYLTGDESLTSREWIGQNICSTGALGALYPVKTWTAPNPFGCMKEGDTPSWFFFLPCGGNDPSDPSKPGWGGQFRRDPDGWWRDAPAETGADPRTAVSRWRPDFQRDFARRMRWSAE